MNNTYFVTENVLEEHCQVCVTMEEVTVDTNTTAMVAFALLVDRTWKALDKMSFRRLGELLHGTQQQGPFWPPRRNF